MFANLLERDGFVRRWYTLFTLAMGAVATFLTALVAVVTQRHHPLGSGEIGLALFSVFQVRFLVTLALLTPMVCRLTRFFLCNMRSCMVLIGSVVRVHSIRFFSSL